MIDRSIILLNLEKAVQEFIEIKLRKDDKTYNYNKVVGSLHCMITSIIVCEQADISKEKILELLEPAKSIHAQSPFIKRCTEWPRGYLGDFETIRYIYEAKNKAPKNTLAYFCEEYALLCPSTQQHRNKLHKQAQLVMNSIKQYEETKILSLASGSSIELHSMVNLLSGADIHLVLNDTDGEALEEAKKNLQQIPKCTFIEGNVAEFLAFDSDELGEFDLILAGGLFDYLTDKHASFILKHLRRYLLKDGGRFFFTNIAPDNPYDPWMGYLADWGLIERDEEMLKNFV